MRRTALCVAALLSLFGVRAVRCQGEQPAGIVYLNQSRNWLVEGGSRPWVRLLARELARQAFLLAARDELGLVTRDAWLGDARSPEGDTVPWDIITTPGNPLIVEVVHGSRPKQVTLARHEIGNSGAVDYRNWITEMEMLSRTKFVEALKQAGLEAQPRQRNEKLVVPERIEELLGEMNFLSQFRVVRELHAMIRSQGESPALLGALVRGYANLGVTTEYYWHPAHEVFKARALLYAQRMLVEDEKSPEAKWHRAYALALTGLHARALTDLDEADQLWQAMAEKDRTPQPAWVQLIGPFCRYEIDLLDQHVRNPKLGQLAALLKYLAVEQAGGQAWAVQAAVQTLPVIPECYRVYDGLCEFVGVSTGHSATTEPVRLAGEKLYGRVESMPGLPEEVCRIVRNRTSSGGLLDRLFGSKPSSPEDEFNTRRELINALLKKGEPAIGQTDDAKEKAVTDSGEPSWAALGILIRELSFMQVYRRARFERNCLDVPAEEWLATSAPLVEGHPCRVFLATFAWEAGQVKEAQTRLAKLDVTGSAYPAYRLYEALLTLPDEKARTALYFKLVGNQDDVVRDLIILIRSYGNQDPGKQTLDTLLTISPYSPMARKVLVQYHWDDIQEKADQWDKGSAPYPGLSSSLAERYTNLGRWDDAERCLKAAIKVLPSDLVLYRQLATIYEQQGQTDRWLATLEEYLKQPDYGLEHFAVQSQIAHHFMDRKQWEKALPYAEGAAECYSAWGLSCAAACNEGLQRWGKAEQYYRACSERYRSSSLDWYFFCRRTGEGDLEGAHGFAKAYIEKLADLTVQPDPFDLITFYLLEDEPEKALSEIEKMLGKNPDADDAFWMALIADQLKDAKKRDVSLNRRESWRRRRARIPIPIPPPTA